MTPPLPLLSLLGVAFGSRRRAMVTALLLAVALVALSVHDAVHRARVAAAGVRACQGRPSIAVVMTTERCSEPARALFAAFEGAACASRLTAVVYVYDAAPRPSDVMHEYAALVRRYGRAGGHDVRRVRVVRGSAVGRAAQLAAAIAAVKESDYVLLLGDDVRLVRGWDAMLLRAAARLPPDRGARTLLSAPPLPGQPLSAFPHGTFTTLGGFSSAALPLVAPAAMQRRTARPQPLVWAASSLLFAPSAFFSARPQLRRGLPSPPPIVWPRAPLADGEEDAFFTAEAAASGWGGLFSVPGAVATQSAAPKSPALPRQRAGSSRLRAALQKSGLGAELLSPHGRLGISRLADEGEVSAKFGSRAALEAALGGRRVKRAREA